jgi:argininosuccinate lyase
LQEDKPALFDSFATVEACLEVAPPIVRGTQWNRSAISERLERGYLDATSLMEYMIRQGVPQRTAHHSVGQLVGLAIQKGARLAELALDDFQQVCPGLDSGVYGVLGVENAVRAYTSYGSSAPQEVEKQVARWKDKLGLSNL